MSQIRRKRIVVFILPLLLAGLAAGGWAYRQHHRYKHIAVHDTGMVYRSAWVEPDVFSELIEQHQLRSVVNLCRPGEMGDARWEAQRKAVTGAGARLFEVSMPTTIDATDPEIAKHIEILSNPDNYPMIVHCQHGVTRTAKFLSIYDILFRNMSAEESLAAQPLFGRDQHNVNITAFVKNFAKEHQRLYPEVTADRLDELRR